MQVGERYDPWVVWRGPMIPGAIPDQTRGCGLMSHADLVERAARWLRNSLNCRVVFSEPSAPLGECPDAIGWVGGRCVIVECKSSRSDFLADQNKLWRRVEGYGLGDWRFYLTSPGLLDGLTIPEGWGWYEVRGRAVVFRAGNGYANAAPNPNNSNRKREIEILLWALRQGLSGQQ